MQEPNKTPVIQKIIAHVELHELFFVISEAIGFTVEDIEDYEEEIIDLVEHWREQGFIEIYTDDADRKYGRVKHMASVNGSVPWYLNLYHSRVVKGDNDPLVVLTFDETVQNGKTITVASIRFLAIHDDLFGPLGNKSVKFNEQQMKNIRMRIDKYRQQGDAHNAAKAEEQNNVNDSE